MTGPCVHTVGGHVICTEAYLSELSHPRRTRCGRTTVSAGILSSQLVRRCDDRLGNQSLRKRFKSEAIGGLWQVAGRVNGSGNHRYLKCWCWHILWWSWVKGGDPLLKCRGRISKLWATETSWLVAA